MASGSDPGALLNRLDGAASYAAVLRLPGAPRAFTAATLGRSSYATLSLSLLVAVHRATGSYAAAGVALSAFALASVVMPVKSRLIDRRGQRRVLPVLAGGFAASLLLMPVAATSGVSASPIYVALSAVAGLAAPPLGPSMRALWAVLTPDADARQRAYSLDGVVEEMLYAIGPLVVGVTLSFGGGNAALTLTAVLNVVGTVGMATSPVAARHGAAAVTQSASRLLGPFRQPGFGLLVVAMLGIGVGGGPLEVAILARAQDDGHRAAAGYLFAGMSVGSALGGLVWGHVRHRRRISTQLGTLVAVMAAGGAAAAAAPTLLSIGVVLTLTGMVSAPALIVAYLAADDLVPEAGRTEATTWVNTATNVGIALGAAAAGVLIDDASPGTALAAGAAVLGLTSAAVFATRPGFDIRTPLRP